MRGFWYGTKGRGGVELRVFWCRTEGCVEPRGFRCGTDVLNRGGLKKNLTLV